MTFTLKKKELKERYVLKFWYCEKYNIFKYLTELGYTYGIYWRNETVYTVYWSNTLLSTWYRPTGERPLNDEKREKLNKYLDSEKWREKTKNRNYDKRKNYINKKVYDLIQEHFRIEHEKKWNDQKK